eukprot:2758955-Lingulodinium_polyedra.AAC.1
MQLEQRPMEPGMLPLVACPSKSSGVGRVVRWIHWDTWSARRKVGRWAKMAKRSVAYTPPS